MTSRAPWIVLLRKGPITSGVLSSIWRVWGDDPVDIRGRRLSLDTERPDLRDRLQGGSQYGERIIIPLRRLDGVAHQVIFHPEPKMHLHPEEDITVDIPWMQGRREEVVLVMKGVPTPTGSVSEMKRLVDLGRRIAPLLSAEFAFGDDPIHFTDPDLVDPRTRIWPLAYYGRGMVERLGLARIEKAGFDSVERDDRGGVWTRLAPLPFEPSREIEARRVRVEKALRLHERFPSSPPLDGGSP